MENSTRIVTASLYVALAFSGMPMSTGCEARSMEYTDSVSVAIRFEDDNAPHDTVASVLVDTTVADSDQPLFTNLELTRLAPDVWRRDVAFLPRNQRLHFAARALGATGEVAFSGETLAILTTDNQDLQIPLAPVQHTPPFQVQRIVGIAYPMEMFPGQEEQVTFTIQAYAGATIGIQITALGSTRPAPEFSPATGAVTLINTVADFMVAYAPLGVTVDTDFDYQVTISDTRTPSAATITSGFRTHVTPRPPSTDIVIGTQPSALFNPIILGLTANGSEVPGTVKLAAAVSADSAPDKLVFQWSYVPSPGTPNAMFAHGGLGNPGLLQGYTVEHQGILTLMVTDEHDGTTTLHYQLARDQFADPVDHGSAGGLGPSTSTAVESARSQPTL